MKLAPAFLSLLLAIPGTTGCTRTEPTYPVTGTVSFNGEVVADGNIVFVPEAPDAPREGGNIRDGKFSFSARAGKKRVEITAAHADPKLKGPKGEPQFVDYIPVEFNTQSKLTEEVMSGGANQFEFKIQSK